MSDTFQRSLRRLSAGAHGLFGLALAPLAFLLARPPRDPLARAVGQMLMIGFYGKTTRSLSARLLAAQARAGQIGGVFFVLQNVGTREQASGLVRMLRDSRRDVLLAIDHEGGVVQRLTSDHGFTDLPSARVVADTLSPAEARALYAQAGRELAAFGFDVNLGPVVDIDHPACPAVGRFGRAYGPNADRIVPYATAFVEGFRQSGVACAIKHFPGHGRAEEDSHDGITDITGRWRPADLEPFRRMIESKQAPIVMGGHLRLAELEPEPIPTTISRAATFGVLRMQLGFDGVVLTDDLDMGALSATLGRRQAVLKAIAAGNDMLMIKNLFGYDPLLPWRAARWVRKAIAANVLSEEQIMESAARIARLRHPLAHQRRREQPIVPVALAKP